MKIICNICQKEIDDVNLDQEKGIATCIACNNSFDYKFQVESTKSVKRAEVVLPNSIKLKECDDCLHLEYIWRGSQLIFLTPFSIAWIMIPIMFYLNNLPIENSLLVKSYMIFHIVLGAILVYYCLAGFFNKTKIIVSRGLLSVKDIPLSFFRNVDIVNDELDQLYAKEKV